MADGNPAGSGTTTSTRPSLGEFFRQVRQEGLKVTWPTRKETLVTTAMVFVMSFAAALFFLAVDGVLSRVVRLVLELFGG
jgi:preprotein translocase subunit SecE